MARTPSCSRDLLRLPMFLGGLVLPFPRRLSSVLQLSAAAAAAAATATGGPLGGEHQQAPETWGYGDAAGEPPLLQPSPAAAAAPRGHKGGKHERDASHPHAGERKREASGSKRTVSGTSFLVQPVKTSALSLKVAHDKYRPGVPAFHVRLPLPSLCFCLLARLLLFFSAVCLPLSLRLSVSLLVSLTAVSSVSSPLVFSCR